MQSIKNYIIKPGLFFSVVIVRLLWWLPDSVYLKLLYRAKLGRKLNLKNPSLFSEKLQWLKLYLRKPVMTIMVDKLNVKSYVAQLIGDKYIIPTIGAYEKFDEINIDELPDSFVIKTTHSGGNTGVVICNDKSKFDFNLSKIKIEKSLKQNPYIKGREWPYKNVERKILIEKMLPLDKNGDLIDYKFYCFNGYVDCVLVCVERNICGVKYYFFDRDWNLLRINTYGEKASKDFTIPKPDNFDEMVEIASKLSVGFPFIRIDLYNIEKQIYFGEFTFVPNAGFTTNLLPEGEERFGRLIELD